MLRNCWLNISRLLLKFAMAAHLKYVKATHKEYELNIARISYHEQTAIELQNKNEVLREILKANDVNI